MYAPDKQGVTALSILAPDVMEMLMESASMCDIEFIEDKLYFYWPDIEFGSNSFREKFATVEAVLKQISHKLSYKELKQLNSRSKIQSVPAEAMRLTMVGWKPTILVFVIGYIALEIIGELVPRGQYFVAIIFYTVLGYFAWKLYRQQKIKKAFNNRYKKY